MTVASSQYNRESSSSLSDKSSLTSVIGSSSRLKSGYSSSLGSSLSYSKVIEHAGILRTSQQVMGPGTGLLNEAANGKIVCWLCKEKGHRKKECKARNSDREVFSNVSGGAFQDWCIDSGATRHMCGIFEIFQNFTEDKGSVKVADGNVIASKGFGDIKLQIFNSSRKEFQDFTLEDVLYVPKMDGNLISVKRITDKGYSVFFDKVKCTIERNGEKLSIANFKNGLYRVDVMDSCFKANTEELCLHQWHKVLAHRNLKHIKRMESKGLKIAPCDCSDVCEACIKGKMASKPFPKKAKSVENVFDVIVSDVCGPMQTESLGRSRYFVTFIDVFSGYTTVETIRSKDEVTKTFIEYIESVKTQFKVKPKVIRTDRGGEYLNKEFQDYLKKEGIKSQCTVGYAPQQNGIAERKNRTLTEAMRTMLADSGLPKSLWAEALHTACYVLNRVISENKETSPYEVMYKVKTNFTDLHPFGSKVYVKIEDQKRRKLDVKAEAMKFIGYDDQAKGYRLLGKNNKVIISRNVIFFDTIDKVKGKPKVIDVEINESKDTENKGPESKETEFAEVEFEYDPTPIPPPPIPEEHDNVREEEEEEQEFDNTEEEYEDAQEDLNDTVEEREIPQVQVQEQEQEVRRSGRVNQGQLPKHLEDYKVFTVKEIKEPKDLKEALHSEEKSLWMDAMKEELKSIKENDTWELVDLPRGRKAIGCKWVFKVKKDEKGTVSRFKARLVAKGFSQKYGVDYDEVFAPVVRATTFRIMLSVAAERSYRVKHYDVKTAFLHGKLQEEIYMKQPPGFEESDKVCRLKKGLYGLKQAARQWNIEITSLLEDNGYRRSKSDPCLFSKGKGQEVNYVLMHVDDILMSSNSEMMMNELFVNINKVFELKDLGEVKNFLSIEIGKDTKGNFMISQEKYIDEVVSSTGLKDAKVSRYPLDPGYDKVKCEDYLEDNTEYQKMIGMLLYIATNTRPDISASVSMLSQKIKKPSRNDLNEVKRVIRYLKGTKELRLKVSDKDKEIKELYGYSDANWAENKVDRKSNSGYICMLNGGTVSWACRKQDCVSLSSTEAEYIALSETVQELVWIRNVCKDFGIFYSTGITVKEDNQSCIKLAENNKFSNRTKHIDTRFQFIKDLKEKGQIQLEYCPTQDNTADMLTKPLSGVKIKELRTSANLKS